MAAALLVTVGLKEEGGEEKEVDSGEEDSGGVEV